jgi:hypothetical protein
MGGFKSRRGAEGLGRRLLFAGVLCLALAICLPARASAHGASFSLKALAAPRGLPYFVFDSAPDATVAGRVRVINGGDRGGTVRLFGADAVTGVTTGAVYRARTDPRHDVGAWLSLPIHQVTLAPGQSRVVPFRVAVPRGAGSGQHLGGIVAENARLTKASRRKTGHGSFRVDIRNLSILAVQVNLPGPRVEKLNLTSVAPGPAEGFQTLLVGMRNEGNRLLKGTGSLVVRSEDPERSKRVKFKVDTFVPHTRIADPIPVPGQALPAGHYDAVVHVTYGRGHVARLATSFTISDKQIEQTFGSSSQGPPSVDSSSILPLILAALGALLLGFLVAWLLLRRHDRRPSPAEVYYVTAIHFEGGSGHEHIAAVRWQNARTLVTGQSTIAGMVGWLNSDGELRVRDTAGAEVRVGVFNVEPPTIRTYSDGVWTDDLLNLPRY